MWCTERLNSSEIMGKLLFLFVQWTVVNFSPWFTFLWVSWFGGRKDWNWSPGLCQNFCGWNCEFWIISSVRWELYFAFLFVQMLWFYYIPMTLQWQNIGLDAINLIPWHPQGIACFGNYVPPQSVSLNWMSVFSKTYTQLLRFSQRFTKNFRVTELAAD